jgi:molybdopterin/thiamine biosynthesis adenylyltransferase
MVLEKNKRVKMKSVSAKGVNKTKFDFNDAFRRNIGLMTQEELSSLKDYTIAIVGMGGVGSNHLMNLVRQGFSNFKIADMDGFEMHNFNRQYGATMNSLNRPKAEVMKEKALEVNPDCNIEVYDKGLSIDKFDEFFSGVDLVVDALDFFVIELKRSYFNYVHAAGIPIITAGPMGYSCASLIFMPDGPNFDKYFGVDENTSYDDLIIHFALGISPKLLHMSYMKNVSLENKSGPSSIAAVTVCSGFVTTNALKILLGWGHIKAVPHYHQFDMMKNKYVCNRLWFGLNSPWQKLKVKIAVKMMSKKIK